MYMYMYTYVYAYDKYDVCVDNTVAKCDCKIDA